MLAARDQENLVARHHNGATLKHQQSNRQFPKTPMKIPLNDENTVHKVGGAKSILTGRSKGNENLMNTTKGTRGLNGGNFVTPMEPRVRAVLGDKTTNGKAKGLQGVSVKSAVREIEQSQVKAPATVRPKSKQLHAESHKLQVHVENADEPLEEEIEYCPPQPKDLPYESDVFPDGVLSFEGLKPENLFRGVYQHYHNDVDEDGVSRAGRELAKRNRKAMEEGIRRVQQDLDSMDWSIRDMPELQAPTRTRATATIARPSQAKPTTTLHQGRRPVSAASSRQAANALAMSDGTRSLQRSTSKTSAGDLQRRRRPFLVASHKVLQSGPPARPGTVASEARMLEACSRTTLGYNKGKAAASVLAKDSTSIGPKTDEHTPNAAGYPRPETISSTESERTITPARYAQNVASSAAVDDDAWKERVPFLAIFDQGDDDEFDLFRSCSRTDGLGGAEGDEEEEEFELKLPE